MDELTKNIEAYDKMRDELEALHMGKWVLFYKQQLVNIYNSFEQAAEDAVRRFSSGPYLIRQVGAPPVTLSASVMFKTQNDNN